MAPDPQHGSVLNLRTWLRSCAVLFAVSAVVSLVGRAVGSWEIAAVIPGGNVMGGNGAIMQLVLAGGLWLMAAGHARSAAAFGWAVAVFAALIGSQHFHGVSLGIDELFVRHTFPPPMPHPGRLALNTSLGFMLAGITVALLARRSLPTSLLTLTSGLLLGLSLLALLSYATGLRLVFAGGLSFGMSVVTALMFAGVAATAILALGRDPTIARPARPLALAALMLLSSVGVFSFHLYEDHLDAHGRGGHSREVVASLNQVELLLTQLQSAARGYLMAGHSREEETVSQLSARLGEELQQLERLVADRPELRPEFGALRKLVQAEQAHVDGLRAARRERGLGAVAEPLAAGDRELMESVRDQVGRMEMMELRQQVATDDDVRRIGFETIKGILLGNVLAGVFTFLALYLSRRAEDARHRLERARVVSEAALRDNEVRYRTLVEQTGQMVYDLDLASGGIHWYGDQAIRQITGRTEAEFQDVNLKEWEALIHPEDRAEATRLFDEALTGSGLYHAEYRFRHRGGDYRYVEDQGAFLNGPDGKPARMIGRMSDISARKAAEAAIRANEERLERIFSAMAEGLVVQDAAGAIIVCNAAAQRILGLGEAEILGRTWSDPRWQQVRPDGSPLPLAEHPAEVTQRTRSRRHGVEVGLTRPDGARIWISFNCEALTDPDGGQTLVVSTFADVTERRHLLTTLAQARDQALEASRLKSEFLANVSHEIRTPMNGIIGMVNLLLEHRLDEEQQQMARLIQQSADSLMTIINDLLDFAKIEAGRMRIEAHEFQLGQVIGDVMALLEPRAQVKGLSLEREFDDASKVRLLGDGGRIRQVLLNLLGNAVKFTERGCIRAVLRGGRETPERLGFRVEVHDTGIGIAREAGRHLFQAFTQADGTTTRRFGGTGLGLAISRQLVELMGGSIGFTSEEGKGSVFWFELDLPKAGVAAGLVSAASFVVPPRSPRRRLLLAEDNSTNQIVARQMLERMGHLVEVAGDGDAALARLGQGHFDAVLMDCQMPVVDGFEATRRVRAGEVPGADPRVPIIALTAYAHPEDRRRCLEAGMDEYLTKPLRIEALVSALERCLGTRPKAPRPAPIVAPGAVLDEAQLAQLRLLPGATRPQLLDELVDIFRQEAPAMISSIRELTRRHEAPALATAAHRLAGSASNLGAVPFREAALAVEAAARAGDWAAADERCRILEQEWVRLLSALESVSSRTK